jgi:hypothetical protein
MKTETTAAAPTVGQQRLVSRRRTPYKDSKGNQIYADSILEGAFTAPWDYEQQINLRFRLSQEGWNKQWWCRGINSSHEDDTLKRLSACCRVIEPTNKGISGNEEVER